MPPCIGITALVARTPSIPLLPATPLLDHRLLVGARDSLMLSPVHVVLVLAPRVLGSHGIGEGWVRIDEGLREKEASKHHGNKAVEEGGML